MIAPVHFIHLGGEWTFQHWRAVETAKRHVGPELDRRHIWTVDPERFAGREFWPHHITIEELVLPGWLRDHPIGLANVKDYYAYRILREYGGLYLDLDTISLRPAWDLLTADVCMSTEFPEGHEAGEPYNTATLLAKQGAPILRELEMEAMRLLTEGYDVWGGLGPHLISHFCRANPEPFSPAPFGVLNGWSYHDIGSYYRKPRDPGPHCRVIHLYSSDHLDEYHGDRWMP